MPDLKRDRASVLFFQSFVELYGKASADTLENLDEYDREVIEAMISEGYTLSDAIENKDNCMVYYDCDDMEDVAMAYCEECGILDSIPDHLRNYFDFKAYGRDMSFEGQFVFTSNGNCVQIM